MKRWHQVVRVLTVAPLLAGVLLALLALWRREIFGGPVPLWTSVLFLTVLPLLAYPLQRFCPHFQKEGRRGQRLLAMIFAVAGYVLCCVTGLLFHVSGGLWVIYLEYLLCGAVILLFNQVLRRKISGHTCGVMGPVMLLFHFKLYLPAVAGVLMTVLVGVVSVQSARHTPLQVLGGSLVPVGVMALLQTVF